MSHGGATALPDRSGRAILRRAVLQPRGPLAIFVVLAAALATVGSSCPGDGGGVPLPALEQYHSGATRPWQSYWKFQNFCEEDLVDPTVCGEDCDQLGALQDDEFAARIENSRDRDQMYFFSRGFQAPLPRFTNVPRTSAIHEGIYGVLSGDSEWPRMSVWDPASKETTQSIRYYDRGDCSGLGNLGTLRRGIFDSFREGLKDLTPSVKVLSQRLRPLLGTTECGDPYIAYADDYFEYRMEYELKIGSLLPPYDASVYVEVEGWFQLGSGRRCVRTDLSSGYRGYGYFQGDYKDASHCRNHEAGYAWRDDQLEIVASGFQKEFSLAGCLIFIDPLCGLWWDVIKLGLNLELTPSRIRRSLERSLHSAMWADNSAFEGGAPCESDTDCLEHEALGNFNTAFFDVRCKQEWIGALGPTSPVERLCEQLSSLRRQDLVPAVPPPTHRCQVRPTIVRRVDVHPDRFELVFLEHGEGRGSSGPGIKLYRDILLLAGQCAENENPPPGGGTKLDNWYCGDGKRDQHEQCDGHDFGSDKPTCEDRWGAGSVGEVSCGSDCRPRYTMCCVPAPGSEVR